MKTDDDNKKGKGRILRLKRGYNPNSSSVGSQLPYFLAFAVGSGVISVITMNVLSVYDKRIRKKNEDSKNKSENDD